MQRPTIQLRRLRAERANSANLPDPWPELRGNRHPDDSVLGAGGAARSAAPPAPSSAPRGGADFLG
eukprot:11738545-Alexandrium_andersonii.AAC.1